MRHLLTMLLLVSGCNREQIAIQYQLGIDPSQVALVETVIGVDPADPRMFFADQPYRAVAQGVGYEVLSEADGRRVMRVRQEAALGFKFDTTFMFTLLPPVDGNAPPLLVRARAVGATRNMLGEAAPQEAVFGPGAQLTVTLADQRCGSEACADDEACCGGVCTRIANDAKNCGACGTACGSGEGCSGKLCRCGGASACAAGQTCCGDGCFDTQSDRFNCGGCGKTCNNGESCVAGVCKCEGAAACGVGGLCCPAPTPGCSTTGTCMCGGSACPVTAICCGPSGSMMCKDYLTDDSNCGMCAKSCTGGLHCQGGQCRCGGSVCSPSDTCCGTHCANLANDVNNCGTCGKQCRNGETCSGGACHCGGGNLACGAGQICCGSVCKNALTDRDNCGSCDNVCGSGEDCVAGSCGCQGGPRCVGTQICCPPGAAQLGGCFDKTSDPQHCGDCATRCNSGESCVMGTCQATNCLAGCFNGNQCSSLGGCVCNDGPPCTGASFCCGSGCTDLLTDEQNCGVCDKKCGKQELCCNGSCRGQDGLNCGECGRKCAPLTQCCVCEGIDAMCLPPTQFCPCGLPGPDPPI